MRNTTLLAIQVVLILVLGFDLSQRLASGAEIQPFALLGLTALLVLAVIQLVRVARERRGLSDSPERK